MNDMQAIRRGRLQGRGGRGDPSPLGTWFWDIDRVLLLLVIMFRPLGLISFVLGERERVGSFGKAPKETGNAAP